MNRVQPRLSIAAEERARAGRPAKPLERLARRILLSNFERLRRGELIVREGGEESRYGRPDEDGLCAIIDVRDPAMFGSVILGGSAGAGRAYMREQWSTPDLTELVRVLVRNREFLERWRGGPAALLRCLTALKRIGARNTIAGSRRNIGAHYDLSNDFFALFLDKRMMYSSALFDSEDWTLDEASTAKLNRICRGLALGPEDHVVEIGTGWGGFAIHAAREFGCRVTTTTISREQFEFARRSVRDAGLEDLVEVVLRDYREMDGKFDALVSIEMIEAVGAEYLDLFFARCSRLLKPDGRMMLQAIMIGDDEFERAARSVDFIQEYIFPGSCLPSLGRISEAIRTETDLRPLQSFDLTPHYARTLQVWRERLLDMAPRVRALGFDDAFLRMWKFYLCYCEGGFREGRIRAAQLLFGKPAHASLEAEGS